MDRVLRGNSSTDKFNLSHHCHLSNLVIRPRKGTAIMWYNHHIDTSTGWLGAIDLMAVHGGCDVIKGEKWISNMWITAPYDMYKHKPSAYLNWVDFRAAQVGDRTRVRNQLVEEGNVEL